MKKIYTAVYIRVSTRDQFIYGYGLDAQKEKAKSFLKLYDYNTEDVKYFIEEGVSAKDMDRPKIKELTHLVETGRVDCIVILKLDRLTRNVVDMYNFIELLIKHNCNLIAIMDNLDIQTANGRMLVGILAIIAQWERETISERTNDGLLEMANKGKFPVGYTPYGYNKDPEKFLTINEEERKYVELIFEKACEGYSMKDIERELQIHGCSLSWESIKRVLTKPLYYGYFKFKGKVYLDIVPPLVSKEVYEEANMMVSQRFKKIEEGNYYFGYKVKCTCGTVCLNKSTNKIDGKQSKTYYYYYCKSCNQRFNQDELLEKTLIDILNAEEVMSVGKKKKDYIRELKRLNAKIDGIYNTYVYGEMKEKVYYISLLQLEAERSRVASKLSILRSDKIYFNTLSDLEKRSLIDERVKSVIVDTEAKIVVSLQLQSEYDDTKNK